MLTVPTFRQRSRRHASLIYAAMFLLIAAALLTLMGCQPAGAYVVADRAIYEAVAPAHRRYLIEDSGISPASKELRLQTLEQWRKLIESAEAAQGATSRPAR